MESKPSANEEPAFDFRPKDAVEARQKLRLDPLERIRTPNRVWQGRMSPDPAWMPRRRGGRDRMILAGLWLLVLFAAGAVGMRFVRDGDEERMQTAAEARIAIDPGATGALPTQARLGIAASGADVLSRLASEDDAPPAPAQARSAGTAALPEAAPPALPAPPASPVPRAIDPPSPQAASHCQPELQAMQLCELSRQ
jgi:hypothetical protein